jgi:hypothetical protein
MELTVLGRKELLAKQLDRLLWRLPKELQDQILLWHFSVSRYEGEQYCNNRTNIANCWKKDGIICSICMQLLRTENRYIKRFWSLNERDLILKSGINI